MTDTNFELKKEDSKLPKATDFLQVKESILMLSDSQNFQTELRENGFSTHGYNYITELVSYYTTEDPRDEKYKNDSIVSIRHNGDKEFFDSIGKKYWMKIPFFFWKQYEKRELILKVQSASNYLWTYQESRAWLMYGGKVKFSMRISDYIIGDIVRIFFVGEAISCPVIGNDGKRIKVGFFDAHGSSTYNIGELRKHFNDCFVFDLERGFFNSKFVLEKQHEESQNPH